MSRHNFLRRNTTQYLRLGSKRKKMRKWRKPTGRDNKMRLKIKGRPKVVSIGYKSDSKLRGKIDSRELRQINNLQDVKNADKKHIYKLGKVGGKKKIEIAKLSKELNLEFINFNYNKLLKLNEKISTSKKMEVKK